MKIFLCESIHPKALQLLRENAELINDWAQIGEVDGIIDRNLTLDRKMLEKAASLKAIAIHGTGTDGVDLNYCRERGITVFNVPYQNADSVAELIVGMSLMLLRKLHLADRLILAGAPIKNAPPELFGSELAGKTFGMIGVGDIALRAARILRDGFRMKVIGHSPSLTPEKAESLGIGYCGSNEEVLQKADIVNIGVRLTPETKGMIDKDALSLMKPTAVLINTARGGVIDETALYEALTNGMIAGAACDVFVSEPPTKANPLVGLDNFIALPHLGANTEEALYRVGIKAAENLLRALKGETPEYLCI